MPTENSEQASVGDTEHTSSVECIIEQDLLENFKLETNKLLDKCDAIFLDEEATVSTADSTCFSADSASHLDYNPDDSDILHLFSSLRKDEDDELYHVEQMLQDVCYNVVVHKCSSRATRSTTSSA